MRRTFATCLLCLMMACTAFSQSNYPRPVVIDGDTVEAITRPQMRSLIMLRYAADACDSQRTVLLDEVAALTTISHKQDSAFYSAQEELAGYDAEVRLLNARIGLKSDELKLNQDLMKRKNRRALAGGLTGSGVALAIGLIVGLFIHK